MVADVYSCITDHPGSWSDCLDVLVLRIAYLAYKEQYGDMQQDRNRYRNVRTSLMLSYSQKNSSQLSMIAEKDTEKFKTVIMI